MLRCFFVVLSGMNRIVTSGSAVAPWSIRKANRSLHVSPRGEAKWVRGPSGRGVRRLARAGVLDSTSSTASKRNEVLRRSYRVLRPSGGEKCRLAGGGMMTLKSV